MKIDEIENGIVFDHIAAGKGMEVYNTLRLDKLKCQVAIIQNAKSEKMGAKDIIKINELLISILMCFAILIKILPLM